MNTGKLGGLNVKINKFILDKITDIKGNPHRTALGMSVGVFIAATPTIPFHTALALILATLLRGNKAAAVLGVWFSNPITIPIIYVANYKIGVILLGKENCLFEINQISHMSDMLRIGVDIMVIMIVGGLVLGIILSLLAYLLTIWVLKVFKNRDRSRQNTDETYQKYASKQ